MEDADRVFLEVHQKSETMAIAYHILKARKNTHERVEGMREARLQERG